MKKHNPNCDGSSCVEDTAETRRLPTGGNSAVILCKACYSHEIRFREERNGELGFKAFELPAWESLEIVHKG